MVLFTLFDFYKQNTRSLFIYYIAWKKEKHDIYQHFFSNIFFVCVTNTLMCFILNNIYKCNINYWFLLIWTFVKMTFRFNVCIQYIRQEGGKE